MLRIPTSLAVLALAASTAACRKAPQSDTSAAAVVPAGTPTSVHDFTFHGDYTGPLGLQLYSVRNEIPHDIPGTLARVRALGFREVELAGTYGLTPAQFRTALDSAGIRATSMHVGYEQYRDSLQTVLADAKTLGVQYVGTAWIPHKGVFTEADARRTAADFNKWGKAAKAQGLQFFYHCHGYEFVPGADGVVPMDVLMRETDPDAVKFEMDVFWISRPGQDPVAWLKKYPTRWRLLHLKDMRKGTPTNVNTGAANADSAEVPIGSGQIDYRGVLRTAKEVGVQKYYIEDETSHPFTTMPQSIDWLESVRY